MSVDTGTTPPNNPLVCLRTLGDQGPLAEAPTDRFLLEAFRQHMLDEDLKTWSHLSLSPNLMPRVELVSIDTSTWVHRADNALVDIYELRGDNALHFGWKRGLFLLKSPYRKAISETDNVDHQGTIHMIVRLTNGEIACVVRVHPTRDQAGQRISMLETSLSDLLEDEIPDHCLESSRLIVNRKLSRNNPTRTCAIHMCIAATILYAHDRGFTTMCGFMLPKLWETTFQYCGTPLIRLGRNHTFVDEKAPKPYDVFAALMVVNDDVIRTLTERTGMTIEHLDRGRSAAEVFGLYRQFLQSRDQITSSAA